MRAVLRDGPFALLQVGEVTPNGGAQARAAALEVIEMLAREVGPRRPCSEAEHRAGRLLAGWLEGHGVEAQLEPFRGYSSFGHPYGLMLAAALGAALLQGRHRLLGGTAGVAAFAALAAESDLRLTPVSGLLSRRPSANVVARVPARTEAIARVCLCAHMDSSRSGLLFHPRVVRRLPLLLRIPAIASATVAAGPLLRRVPGATAVRRGAAVGLAFSLAMIAERELRGEDVAGANDNASGCGVVAQLAAECVVEPLERTEVLLLITGCEEAGMLGAQAYLRGRERTAPETTFINFDTVGGDVPLTYVLREGGPPARPASPRLVGLLERIAERRPDLGLAGADGTAGLPTDLTPALARGYQGITLLAQADTIPNYHWPTDTIENVAPRTVGFALEAGRELLRELDRDATVAQSDRR